MKAFKASLLTLLLLVSSVTSAPAEDDDDFDDFNSKEDPSPEVKLASEPKALQQIVNEPRAQPNLPQQQHGGNSGYYKQLCGGTTSIICNPSKNFACVDNLCKCRPTKDEAEGSYVYSLHGDQCYKVASEDEHFSCTVDEQCKASKRGRHSRCNSALVCECYDDEGLGRATMLHEGLCYVKKQIGDTCSANEECDLTIKGQAVCSGLPKSNLNVGLCHCEGGHEWDNLIEECLELRTINETCKAQIQCNDPQALGPLGHCDSNRQECTCRDTVGFRKTGYLDKKCYFSVGVNETCSVREECVVGYDKKALCQAHPSYKDEKVCQCPRDMACDGAIYAGSAGLLVSTILAVFKFYY